MPGPTMLTAARAPGPLTAGPDDLCLMPYTSGTTGQPKGCMHTHRSVMSTLVGGIAWFGRTQDAVYLSVLPFFHVTGLSGSLNGPLYAGATIVILPRWDREAAAQCMQRYRVTVWQTISTMMIDFLANPRLADYDLSSLAGIRGGGAAMPAAICAKLKALTGLDYVEGYGMSETMAATHINPTHRPKPQCLGIPVFDVDARVVDPDSLAELPPGESGEIIVSAPQLMQGYWRQPEATAAAFVEHRRQALPAHRRPRPHRRGRLLLHDRPAQAHDQCVGLQGLAGRGRGADVRPPRHPGSLRDRRAGRAARRDGQGPGRAEARRGVQRAGHHRLVA